MIFDNVATVRDAKPGSVDPSDHMAARLNADNPATAIGTSIMLKTMPGDRFNISVDALYEGDYRQVNELSGNDIVRSLMTTLTGGANYDGVPVSELPDNVKTIQSIFNNPNLATQIDQLTNSINDVNAPKAHLNYLFFDDRFNLVAGSCGSMQVVPGISGWQSIVPGGGNNGVVYCASCSTPGYLVAYIDNETIGKDVWFDHFMVGHYTSAVVAEDHYYPFGLTVSQSEKVGIPHNPYKLTTKELESKFDLNLYDFGARMQDMQLGRWNGIDPLGEKYSSLSPYSFCANDPVKYYDPNGKEIWLNSGKEKLRYDNGHLYNKKGKEYTGNLTSFTQMVFSALNKINSTKAGLNILKGLSESKNVFNIQKSSKSESGSEQFVPEHLEKAYAKQIENDPDSRARYEGLKAKGIDLNGGSGGTVYWDPQGEVLPTTSGGQSSEVIDLAHELAHGYDSNRGNSNSNSIDGVSLGERQAVYRENSIRKELQMPLRNFYQKKVDQNGEYLGGTGPSMLDKNNNPILPDNYEP